jgi:ubiquinone/menaquinone biosynthesis C-methylase UbiE
MNEFDEKAKSWDDDPGRVSRARAVAEAIRKHVPLRAEMSAMEYGCGTGLLSFELRGDLGSITMADSSEGMLVVLREKIAALDVVNMNPVKLDLAVDPLPGDRFDLVYSLMTLHHIPDVAGALRGLHALLRPDGWLAICDLEEEDGSFHDPGIEVHQGFNRSDLERQLKSLGCVEVRSVTAYEVERERGGMKRVYPLFLLLGRKPHRDCHDMPC